MVNKIIKEMGTMSNFQSKVFSFFAWFFGIIFILGGLPVLFADGELISGSLMIIGGCLLLPPIKRLILNRKPNLSRGKITTVGSIIILIAYIFLISNEDISQTTVTDEQILSNNADNGSVEVTPESNEQVVEEEIVSIDAGFEEDSYDDGYNSQAHEETDMLESKRSKLPALSLEFYFTVMNDGRGNPTIISIVSRNKDPILIYDIIVNDGLSCAIYDDKTSIRRHVSFGEKAQFAIVGCDPDQIIEVKVVTEKGYVSGDIEMYL